MAVVMPNIIVKLQEREFCRILLANMADSVETGLAWMPSELQSRAIDYLAQGYSQNRTAALIETSQQNVWYWWNEANFAVPFRAMVAERAILFIQARDAIHDQQETMAQAILHQALSGEIEADGFGRPPLRFDAAIELLRATYWKQRAGGHKQFGA
jgi:hypothetical protein